MFIRFDHWTMQFKSLPIVLGVTAFTIMLVPPRVSAQNTSPAAPVCNIVFLGDSITYGGGTQNNLTQAAPVVAMYYVQQALGPGAMVYISNQGHPGHTSADFVPGSADCTNGEAAAKTLEAAHPGPLLFSIMLGTNDCANKGPNGAPISAADYSKNLHALIDKLLADFPDAKIVVHHELWFSPNTHNTADYEGPSAANRLLSYFPVIDALPADYHATHPGRVYPGDTAAYDYFKNHSLTELNPEPGVDGTFYLHPNVAGAQSLGKLWAPLLVKALTENSVRE